MIKIDKEKDFSEFENFVCHETAWFVWHDDKLVALHKKHRYINFDTNVRYTTYSTWSCEKHEFTGRAERR